MLHAQILLLRSRREKKGKRNQKQKQYRFIVRAYSQRILSKAYKCECDLQIRIQIDLLAQRWHFSFRVVLKETHNCFSQHLNSTVNHFTTVRLEHSKYSHKRFAIFSDSNRISQMKSCSNREV